jgi:hypothetical protein
MSDKNLAITTLLVAAIGTVVIVVLAYKLNNLSQKVDQVSGNPLGVLKSMIGG